MKKYLLIASAIILLAAACNQSQKVFKTKEDCQKATGRFCALACDSLPDCKNGHWLVANDGQSQNKSATSTKDNLPQGEKTGLNTYTNSQYGVTIQYPNSFKLYTN